MDRESKPFAAGRSCYSERRKSERFADTGSATFDKRAAFYDVIVAYQYVAGRRGKVFEFKR